MKVVVTDYTFPDLEIETGLLEPLGHQVVAQKEKLSAERLRPLVADADAVIVQFAPVDRSVVEAMTRAKVIVRYGIGVDNVALDAARERGIPVVNVPDYCIDEVADHTLALLLAATRQVVANDAHVRGGAWGLATPLDRMRTLKDLTVGVVGFGRIGREVVARLRGFRCRVLVSDPVVGDDEIAAAGATAVPFDRLLASSDVVTLHCPSTDRTRGMMNRATFAAMRPGAILVNVGRGDLVDTDALLEALESGHLSDAALDVFSVEPLPIDHPLRRRAGTVLQSHIASASVPAVRKLRLTVAQAAADALAGRPSSNVVNGVLAR